MEDGGLHEGKTCGNTAFSRSSNVDDQLKASEGTRERPVFGMHCTYACWKLEVFHRGSNVNRIHALNTLDEGSKITLCGALLFT